MPDISKDVKLESKTRVLIKKDCFMEILTVLVTVVVGVAIVVSNISLLK